MQKQFSPKTLKRREKDLVKKSNTYQKNDILEVSFSTQDDDSIPIIMLHNSVK